MSAHCGWRCINRIGRAVLLAASVIVIIPGSGSRAAQRLHYDPASCKTDAHGKLYIALGPNVFAMPSTGVVVISELRSGQKPLQPPDPTAPLGCPENPQQLSGYAFPYSYEAPLTGKKGLPPGEVHTGVDLLQLITTETPDEWPGESFQIEFAEYECQRATLHEELPEGLTACRIKPDIEAHITRIEDWGTSYIARSDVYTTPLGRPFVVNCGPTLFTDGIGHCDTAYIILPGLGVTYRFHPYRRRTVLPIEDVIAFDRGLRAAINALLVKNYKWPEQPSDNHAVNQGRGQ